MLISSLFNRMWDVIFFKRNSEYMKYKDLAAKTKELFMVGVDDAYLSELEKAAKGGNLFTNCLLKDPTGRYELYVGNLMRGLFFIVPEKEVYIRDTQEDKYYTLDWCFNWKKFYKKVRAEIRRMKSV